MFLKQTLIALGLGLTVLATQAQTTARDPWIRATVPGQQATGLFLSLSAAKGGTLLSGSTPAAERVEIHEMSMEGNVMKMRELTKGLPLPAGKTVELKPGGYHVMLMGLKKPLAAGDKVPVSLVIEGADKKRETLRLQAVVKALAAGDEHKH